MSIAHTNTQSSAPEERYVTIKSNQRNLTTIIQNQEKHHSRKTFREEYLELLKRFDVIYNEKYVFDSVDEDTPET